MVDEMLVAQAKWLPQYRREITKAKKRFASEPRLGTKSTKGAARLKTRSVAQLRKRAAEVRRQTAASDKAEADRAKALAKAKRAR